MSGRRRAALVVLSLLALGYGIAFVAAATGSFVPTLAGGTQPLEIGGVFGALPPLYAVGLIVTVVTRSARPLIAAWFVGWFVLAAVEAVFVSFGWGLLMAVNGLLPLVLLLPELRPQQPEDRRSA